MDQEPITEPTEHIEDAGSAMEGLMKPEAEETPEQKAERETAAAEQTRKDQEAEAQRKAAEQAEHEEPGAEHKETAPPPVVEEPPVEDKFDEEIEQISPKSKEAIKILKEKAKTEHGTVRTVREELAKERKERAAEAARIKALEEKTITPEIENELTELRTFKQTYALETDPTVTKEFDDRVKAAGDTIGDVLKSVAVPESTMKFINDNGGLYNFRMSNGLMPQQLKNKDGSRMTHAQFYKQHIEPNLNEAQREDLNDSYAEIRKANRDKSNTIKNLSTNKEAYLERQKKSVEEAKEQWIQRVGAHSKKVLEGYGDAAKLLDVPPNATPEQTAAIEKHNTDYRNAEARAQQIISNVTPENLVEAAIAAGYVTVLQGQNKEITASLEAVTKDRDEYKAKYEKLINAGKTTDLHSTEDIPGSQPKPAANAEDAMTRLVNEGK